MVNPDEQVKLNLEQIDLDIPVGAAGAMTSLPTAPTTLPAPNEAAVNALSAISKEEWEREKTMLYAQLDEKVRFNYFLLHFI